MQTTAIRLAASAGLLTLSLTACTPGAGPAATAASAPASTADANPGSGTLPSAPPEGEGIPAAALLQPDDVRGATAEPLEQGLFSHVRPLRPCGDEPYPSDGSRSGAVAMRYVVGGEQEGSTPTVVAQFIGEHKPGGAADQFAEIGAALEKCPGSLAEGEKRWQVVEADDDSVLVRIDAKYSYADEEPSTVSQYAAMSRVGDAIVVVADTGWENMGGSEDLVRELIVKAEKRAENV